MAKSSKKKHGGKRPKAGRRPTARDPVSPVRFRPEVTKAIDKWAKHHDIGRSDAIRRLVRLGLKADEAK
jgi:hypothetical protein